MSKNYYLKRNLEFQNISDLPSTSSSLKPSISKVVKTPEKPQVEIFEISSSDDDYDEPPVKRMTMSPPKPTFIDLSRDPTSKSCGICKKSTQSTFQNLDCNHTTCNACFTKSLMSNQNAVNKCPVPQCEARIIDEEIKIRLSLIDYVKVLEHQRDVLRKALNLKNPVGDVEFLSESIHLSPVKVANRRRSELRHLQNLESQSYVRNPEPFECPICFLEVEADAGVMLKSCVHQFCVPCLIETVKHSTEPAVLCPFDSAEGSCEFFITEREIRALVPEEIYDAHLNKALKQAESALDNVFHCQKADCIGWVQYEAGVIAFSCPVCQTVNCIKCKVIHEDKTCEQYKFDSENDEKNQKELKMTEEAVKEMIEKGQAMLCPQCAALIQKDQGCDFVKCTACKLGICYVTRKPRLPLKKIVDGKEIIIDGCHCNEKKKKCHPKCNNCH